MAILDLLESRTLIYINLLSIESISKLNLSDDSGEIVMVSGNVITVTAGINDFILKLKGQVPPANSV